VRVGGVVIMAVLVMVFVLMVMFVIMMVAMFVIMMVAMFVVVMVVIMVMLMRMAVIMAVFLLQEHIEFASIDTGFIHPAKLKAIIRHAQTGKSGF
jgi:hypothetical protein